MRADKAAVCAQDPARIRRLARVSLLAAVALVLSYLETMIPLPVALPGIKLGLANIAVAVALFALDVHSAATVALVKVLASGFLFGSPMMLAYSAGGMALAFAGMVALAAVPGVGLVPVSMLAAVLHNAGQLGVAAFALGTPSVFVNLPVMAVAACATGGITGAVGEAALDSLEGAEGKDMRPQIDCAELARSIRPGERIAFVGPNGSGKSTCALQLAGLVDFSDCGAADLRIRHFEGTVGVAFQDPDNQIVAPVVQDDVAFGLENRGTERSRMLHEVEKALAECGIAELALRNAATLSGGQKERVAVAGLVAMSPSLLVFDETTAMLDPRSRARFDVLVCKLCGAGMAVIQITQLLDEVRDVDRAVVFESGAIAFSGTPAELGRKHELLARCGLEELCL